MVIFRLMMTISVAIINSLLSAVQRERFCSWTLKISPLYWISRIYRRQKKSTYELASVHTVSLECLCVDLGQSSGGST
ncbi:hypothetical protein BT69DRAFT_378337 [Atractiella rhizophila]|nr:hypothetical protein BT69DRAFT_378337 [Atractiella rhizophila]